MAAHGERTPREIRLTLDDATILLGLLDTLRGEHLDDPPMLQLTERAIGRLRQSMQSLDGVPGLTD